MCDTGVDVESFESAEGATFTPFLDHVGVGYKVTADDMPDRFVRLVPSGEQDSGLLTDTDVFVYVDDQVAAPADAVCFVMPWADEADETYLPTGRYTVLPEAAAHTCWDGDDHDGTLNVANCAGCRQAEAAPCRFCGYGRVFPTHNALAHANAKGDLLIKHEDDYTETWGNSPHVYLV